MRGIEPRVDAEQPADAPDHQAGADQEHDGQGDVGGDEQLPRERCRRVGRVAPLAVHRAVQIDARGAERGDEAEDEGGRERDCRREGQHTAVDARVGEARYRAWREAA